MSLLRFSDRKELDNFYGPIHEVLLAENSVIYRFITPGANNELGAWWFDEHTHQRLMSFSGKIGKPAKEVARATLAIKYGWNETMGTLVERRIKIPIMVLKGRARFQACDFDASIKNVTFIGGFEQIYIPPEEVYLKANVNHIHLKNAFY